MNSSSIIKNCPSSFSCAYLLLLLEPVKPVTSAVYRRRALGDSDRDSARPAERALAVRSRRRRLR